MVHGHRSFLSDEPIEIRKCKRMEIVLSDFISFYTSKTSIKQIIGEEQPIK